MIQDVVWSVSIVLMGLIAAVFAWVAAGADVMLADYGPVIFFGLEPGVYRVLCLEYCGIAHHEMKAEINVAAE